MPMYQVKSDDMGRHEPITIEAMDVLDACEEFVRHAEDGEKPSVALGESTPIVEVLGHGKYTVIGHMSRNYYAKDK